MKESIHRYFKIGTIQWMSYPGVPVLDTLRKLASDDFFDAIELCQIQNSVERAQAKKLLEQANVTVCYGAQPRLLGPGLNPNALDESEREQAENTLLEAVDEAEYLGAGGIVFLAGKWEAETKEQAYIQLLKTTRKVCSYAAEKNMFVELEVFDYDMDKKSLIGPAPLAARFAGDMRTSHKNFGLLADLSHFPTTYEDSRFVIRTLRPYLTHFHIGNAVVKKGAEGYGDQHPRFGFPNSANDISKLMEFFQILKEEGFFDTERPYVLSFEVKPWKDEEPDLVVAGTKRCIRRAWNLLED